MVWLVGAGPGDPGLITVRGLDVLRQAEVVVFDRLVNAALLDAAPAEALRIDVGKKPRDPEQPRQEAINAVLVEYGRAGKRVVRLKGGDPTVFGRGGEEAMALKAAGVAYELVPGVTSAIAAAESVGIPVTHRGVANGFAVFSGHDDEVAWVAAAAIPTAVFLMGVEALPRIAHRLVEHGRCPQEPVAVIASATLPEQRTVFGTLGDIAQRAAGLEPPAVVVVGQVVKLAEEGPWSC